MKIFYFLLLLFLIFPYTTYSQERNRPERAPILDIDADDDRWREHNRRVQEEYNRPKPIIRNGRYIRHGTPEYQRELDRARRVDEILDHRDIQENAPRYNTSNYEYAGRVNGGRFNGETLFRDKRTGIVFLETKTGVYGRDGRRKTLHIYENERVVPISQEDPRFEEIHRSRENFFVEQRENRRIQRHSAETRGGQQTPNNNNQIDRSNSSRNPRPIEVNQRPRRPEGPVINRGRGNVRVVRPGSPEDERVQEALRNGEQQQTSSNQRPRSPEGPVINRGRGNVRVVRPGSPEDERVQEALRNGEQQQTSSNQRPRSPEGPVINRGRGNVRVVRPGSPEDERIQEALRNREQQQTPDNQRSSRDREVLGKMKLRDLTNFLGGRLMKVIRFIAVAAGSASTFVRDGVVNASELTSAGLDAATGVFQGSRVFGDPISDVLDRLKRDAEITANNSHIFSADRQKLKIQLNDIIDRINDDDESLEQQEKDALLARITEIRDIIQPPTPPRNPPRRRFRSSRRGGINN